VVYDLLMKAAAETTLAIAANPRRLGARIGITAVLHTGGSTLTHHPHVHMIVPGGVLSLDGSRWVTSRSNFLENPAAWRGNLDHLLPATVGKTVHRHAAMPFDQIAAFVDELRGSDDLPARALEFLILTAARTGEVLGARWSEIDLANRLWIVPAERMKAGREHRVALSDRAIAIVEGMPRSGDLVFPDAKRGRPLGTSTFQSMLRNMGRDDVTAHGFRSCFQDWISERTNFPTEVAEMALAHAVGNKVEAS
jgi:integrase